MAEVADFVVLSDRRGTTVTVIDAMALARLRRRVRGLKVCLAGYERMTDAAILATFRSCCWLRCEARRSQIATIRVFAKAARNVKGVNGMFRLHDYAGLRAHRRKS